MGRESFLGAYSEKPIRGMDAPSEVPSAFNTDYSHNCPSVQSAWIMASSSATSNPNLQTGGQSKFQLDGLKFTNNFKNLPVGAWGLDLTLDRTRSDIIQLLAVLRSGAPGTVLAYGFVQRRGRNAAATQSGYSKAVAPLQSGNWVATMLSYDFKHPAATKVLKASICSSRALASATEEMDEHLCRSLKAFHSFPVERNEHPQRIYAIPDDSNLSLDSPNSVEDKSPSQELCTLLLVDSAYVSARIAESLQTTKIDGPQSLTRNLNVGAKYYKGQAFWTSCVSVLVPKPLDKEDPKCAKSSIAIKTSLFNKSSR